jgi:3-oxoacyl-[acyl-carrier-protein] synthase II
VATSHAGAGEGEDAREPIERGLAALPGLNPGLVLGAATGLDSDAEEAATVLRALPGVLLTTSSGQIGDCQAATGAMNIAMGALAIREGVAPALTGLTRPHAGDLGSYLTKPDLPAPVDQTLVLSAAPGSVRGAVLLGAP